jgi:hypothetical protein
MQSKVFSLETSGDDQNTQTEVYKPRAFKLSWVTVWKKYKTNSEGERARQGCQSDLFHCLDQ